ncbi:hypothetical protein BCR39DRAFT_520876 [Naematelia encephala]|uniref:Uncharacterized protein n=1 Tax=Naematelia encephala TaxID=71784 RepID=A0A1Y2BDY3_9TREE|nr:hypothetical protein BCR39DRAFT_520876 [Naematelia encephala]
MIIRDIIERDSATPPPRPPSLSKAGFPVAVHRSKAPSAFARSRQQSSSSASTVTRAQAVNDIPTVQTHASTPISEVESVRASVQRDNEHRIRGGVMEMLRKRAEARLKAGDQANPSDEVVKATEQVIKAPKQPQSSTETVVNPPHREEIAQSEAGPSRVRFTEDTSPSSLKQKYFPNLPSEPAKLAWLQPTPSTSNNSNSDTNMNTVRYDLSGRKLDAAAQAILPSDLGLHHHGDEPDQAGYSMEEILHLCRSTVIAQRITMLGVLAKVLEHQQEPEVVKQAIQLAVDGLLSSSRNIGMIRVNVELLHVAMKGPSWKFSSEPASDPFVPLHEIDLLHLDLLVPKLAQNIFTIPSLSPGTLFQLIQILRRIIRDSPDTSEAVLPLVSIVIRTYITGRASPSTNDDQPSLDALRLVRDIVQCSRACADALQNETKALVQFIISATWKATDQENAESSNDLARELAVEVLRTYQALGRYGFSASLATTHAEVWRNLSSWVSNQCVIPSSSTNSQDIVVVYYKLLSVWTTCAIDPHRTTPEHDLTWAQVSAFGWAEDAVRDAQALANQAERRRELASVMELLCAWIEGVKINGEKGGEEERRTVLLGLRDVGLDTLTGDLKASRTNDAVLLQAVKLHIRLGDVDSIGPLLSSTVVTGLIESCLRLDASSADDPPSSELRYEVLSSATSNPDFDAALVLFASLDLVTSFQPGDEPLALDLVDSILRSKLSTSSSSISHPHGLEILRPLLHHTILPNVSSILGPSRPSHLYLKATASLRPLSSNEPNGHSEGLPLRPDWVFGPLDELLDSASSPAFAQAPPDWDPNELDIVRASLALAQLCPKGYMSRSTLILNLMKVFMLEHNQNDQSSEVEVFRDTSVSQALDTLITPLTTPPSVTPSTTTTTTTTTTNLEMAAMPFLGDSVPFFQFWTDFVSLYEAISFSDTRFGQLVLVPLSMRYPPDYRRRFWTSHTPAVRTIRLEPPQIILEHDTIETYFEPREKDKDILTAYVLSLRNGTSRGFLQDVAIWHVASLFWTIYGIEEEDSLRQVLMIGLLSGPNPDIVKRVLLLDLTKYGEKAEIGQDEKKRRIQLIETISGRNGLGRVQQALQR